MAEKIDQDIVIQGTLVSIAQNSVIDTEKGGGFYPEAGFFQNFTDRGFAQSFAYFQHPAWNRPLTGQRRVCALYEQHPVIFDDDCTHADKGPVGVFALHDSWLYAREILMQAHGSWHLASSTFVSEWSDFEGHS